MVRKSTTISITVPNNWIEIIETDRKDVSLSAHLRKILAKDLEQKGYKL